MSSSPRSLFSRPQAREAGLLLAATGVLAALSVAARSIGAGPVAAAVVGCGAIVTLKALVYFAARGGNRLDGEALDAVARMREQGRQLAIYDRETGLYAYWYFSLRLEEEISRAKRYGQPFALLLVESANARLRDEEEKRLFGYMSDSFRRTDLAAHLGSLRFVVLLSDTDLDGAKIVLDRFRAEFRSDEVLLGLARFPVDGSNWDSLLRAAEASAEAA